MKGTKWIIVIVVVLLIIVSAVMFYRTIFRDETNEINKEDRAVTGFMEDVAAPDGITIIDKIDRPLLPGSNLREGEIEIYDEVVIKTIMLELQKSILEQASKDEKFGINEADRAFSIGTIYKGEGPESGRLYTIEVLKDGTFITSKDTNGKEQFAKGKFGKYTMDYLTGLYTLQ